MNRFSEHGIVFIKKNLGETMTSLDVRTNNIIASLDTMSKTQMVPKVLLEADLNSKKTASKELLGCKYF